MLDEHGNEELELRPWICLNSGAVAPTLPYRITDGRADLGYFRTMEMARAAMDALDAADAAVNPDRQPAAVLAAEVAALRRRVQILEERTARDIDTLGNRIESVTRVVASRTDHLA